MDFEEMHEVIEHHTRDELFGPLLKYLNKNVGDPCKRERVLNNYMYMIHSKRGYEYKHHGSRAYILISEEGKLLAGRVDFRAWEV